MAHLNGFDADLVEPAGDFSPVPAGQYTAVIINSEMKPTKAGNGSFLELTFEMIDGVHRGRRLWSRLNLENANEKAVKIAKGQLASICKAVGVTKPKDSLELHNVPLVIVVRQKTSTDGVLQNEIKGFIKQEGRIPPRPSSPQPASPPWKR
jgi:hypothetical protein